MSRTIPSVRPKKMVSILIKMGFIKKRQSGSHLILQFKSNRVVVPMTTKI
ncbi:MAG: hypothetical protein UR27_C0022G0015 [Candidatus Peregrinibacteria bacterium GW2011_GWA2_33_10]|nr:MAG: hypothetical protein UR27_C0022G0015 [Candidatus Peregrinibacteria bacterium GW2011_GWA2_33_10]KKP38713.1 MAG: hypothetical protein UR30_C0016G0027 [Candidatus Peregrinibacteria bacterium GW2011_GWC2_33_13]